MKFGSNPIWQNAIGGIITAVVLGLFSLMMGFFTNPDSLVAGVETLAIRNPMVGKFDDPQIHDYIKTNFGIELTGALTKAFNRYPMAELAVLRIVNTGKTASKKVVIGFAEGALITPERTLIEPPQRLTIDSIGPKSLKEVYLLSPLGGPRQDHLQVVVDDKILDVTDMRLPPDVFGFFMYDIGQVPEFTALRSIEPLSGAAI
jgi:hypothetical protein